MMKKRKIKRVFNIEHSPFFEETLNSRFKEKLSHVDYNSQDDLYISKKIIYKAEEYAKFMIPDKISIADYYKLSKLATTILYYIITTKLEYNSPTFTLKAEEIIRLLPISSIKKVYPAIKELCDNQHIARTSIKQVYWVNHNRYYKGTYITIKEVQNKENQDKK